MLILKVASESKKGGKWRETGVKMETSRGSKMAEKMILSACGKIDIMKKQHPDGYRFKDISTRKWHFFNSTEEKLFTLVGTAKEQ